MYDLKTAELVLFGKHPGYEALTQICSTDAAQRARGMDAIYSAAERYGLDGPLWQTYLAWLLLGDENTYSLSLELVTRPPRGSLRDVALADIRSLRKLFMMTDAPIGDFTSCRQDRPPVLAAVGARARTLADRLARSAGEEEFLRAIEAEYAAYGVGMFGLYTLFFLNAQGKLCPVLSPDPLSISDLWGYEWQKQELESNTRAFVSGSPANNVLLYGDSGTGKSTCSKAVFQQFAPRGLRCIQVQKHQMQLLPELLEQLCDRRYPFIIYMDDLSFEDDEIEYKYLKGVIEGGLEPRPKNVLIYATSNRRHLVRENWSERDSDDVHADDNKQEKLSLAARFGVSIFFGRPRQEEYFSIVRHLAGRAGLQMEESVLLPLAKKWSVTHGMNGRAARQLVDQLLADAAGSSHA